MSDTFDKIFSDALKSTEKLINEAQKMSAKASPHLDKVDPELKMKYESAMRDLKKQKEEINNLKD